MNDETKTWLWFVPKWPLPAIDGARQASTRLVSQLTACGQRVHLVAYVEDRAEIDVHEANSALGVSAITLLPRASGGTTVQRLRAAISQPHLPITLAPFDDRRARTVIRELLDKNPKSPVILDGLHAGAWLADWPLSDDRPVVYRAHNVERDIWVRAAQEEQHRLRAVLLRWQGRKVERFEKHVCACATAIFPVSDEDRSIFAEWTSSATLQTLPIGMDVPDYASPPDDGEINLLFLGRLDWPPNRDGLKWFLDKVWPATAGRRRNLRVTIVGSGDGKWLESYRTLERVAILGFVDDIEPVYRAASATLVPIFYGSGTRVKAIESCLWGRVCISTRLGVEGIGLQPGQHFIHAETADEWIERLCRLDFDVAARMGRDARNVVKSQFDAKRVAQQMQAAIA